MSEETPPQSLLRQNHLPTVISLATGIIHFAATYFYESSQSIFLVIMLTTPSWFVSFLIITLPFAPEPSDSFMSNSVVQFLFVGFSSMYYGITAGLLVTSHRDKRWKGVVCLCFLVLSILSASQILP